MPNHRGDLGAKKFDGVHQWLVGQRCDRHLKTETIDTTERIVHAENFSHDILGVANVQGAGRTNYGIELSSGGGRPTALLADCSEGFGVTREKFIGRLFIGVRHIAKAMQTHAKFFLRMPGAFTGLTIEINEWFETMGLAANNSHHERKTECPGADKRCGGATCTQPDGQWILQRARENPLAGKRGSVIAGPGYIRAFP